MAMMHEQLKKLNVPLVIFNQRHFASMEMEFEILGARVTGQLQMGDHSYRLEDFSGVYTRLMDDQLLPELKDEQMNSSKRQYCRALHNTLRCWYEIAPARVVNRTAPMGSNFSKPYQAQLIRDQGFAVPETLVTNDPELVLEFRERHKQVIYKSISGIRSIVQSLEDKDLARLGNICWCPVQFQEFVDGTNVRVHTVNTKVFATAIRTDVTDYRYAHQQGSEPELKAIDLPNELAERCVKLSRVLGLVFAGIDLIITPDNQVFCLEVNPSPAFSYYEANTGQPIAQAVARYLAGME